MKLKEYLREIELMNQQYGQEEELYPLVDRLLRNGDNMADLSLRTVAKGRSMKSTDSSRKFLKQYSSFPDLVILDEKFDKTGGKEQIDYIYGCVECKKIFDSMLELKNMAVECRDIVYLKEKDKGNAQYWTTCAIDRNKINGEKKGKKVANIYETSSKRVSDSEIILDEETLMIMNDKRKSLSGTRLLLGPLKERGIKYFTAVPGEKKGKTQQWKYVSSELEDSGKKEFSGSEEQKKIEDDEEIEIPFDGVGLISKEYANYINRALKLDGATSFQIRLPFAKGMLHQVDFREFIQEYDRDGWNQEDPYWVKDAFGIRRDLRKVQIIMTTSMFKCFKWLGDYCGTENDNDPMQFYSEMLHKYKHSLYVAGTNLPYGHSAYTHLSYQMINTLDFTDQEFENIISKHKKFVEDPVSYLKNWNSEEATAYEDTEIDSNVQSWKRAVFSDSQFEKDIYIAEQLNSTRKGLITKLAKGKVAVAGQMRYLCRDLLPLLALLLKNDRDIDKFWPRKLYNRFYMPQDKKMVYHLKSTKI